MDTKSIYVLGRRVIDMFYSKGFSDVNIQFETGPAKGDGIHGEIFHATINAVNKDGAPQDQFELCVPPEMRCFLPKCYGVCDDFRQEMFVLEDLTKKGFCVALIKSVDYDHAVIMLQTVAKLHALSFIYEQRYPKRFKEMANQISRTSLDPLHDEEFTYIYLHQHGEKAMKAFLNAITEESLRKRFETVSGTNSCDKHIETLKDGNIMVILHGDNWHNNHMFKYKNGKPIEGIPIDFQWARYGSIAYDFMYLFLSDTGNLRRNHFHQLVDVYYAELKGFLTLCGYDVNKFCSYEQFNEELKCMVLTSILAFMTAAPLFKNPELTLQEKLSSPETYVVTEEYKQTVNDMVADWANLGFF
ncbi:uncharacterized protein LOC125233359 isoform X2 [Leguminivora glycinivorella]|uniref:uncharacterized protein LOC125233359 isoform X2 n=1 Tax=Leguminivora glycinivorella TaxID=1035111 RepID=UPI00200EE78F|nr:uncharacterized protein LOC125233359 isoform X2 [Leguminivora glycinivorella]